MKVMIPMSVRMFYQDWEIKKIKKMKNLKIKKIGWRFGTNFYARTAKVFYRNGHDSRSIFKGMAYYDRQ